MASAPTTNPFAAEIRLILQTAMVLFVYTVVVGILNGLDLVDFEHGPLLAHVHIGTLGWITMAVFAASLALFGADDDQPATWIRWTARAAPVVALAYGVAFFFTTNVTRPLIGTAMGVVILAFAAWGFMRARVVTLSVPHLGILAGLTTSVLGAVLGILLGLRFSSPDMGISETVETAHPATMVVGFLVPVGMAFIEWVLSPASVTVRATLAGRLQIGLPFLGGVLLLIGSLLESDPLISMSLPFEVVGVAILLVRIAPAVRVVDLISVDSARHAAVAAPFLVVNIGILVYLVANYVEDFEAAPVRLLLALDHSIFVGVLTMSIVGVIMRLSSAPRPAWVDHLVFGGMALGITGFVIGLLADSTPVIRVATPVLGAAILLAIGVHTVGMLQQQVPAVPARSRAG